MKLFLKKIKKKIYEKKFMIILCCVFLGIYIAVFFPRSYNGLSRKAELGEVDELEIWFAYRSRDEHETIVTKEYCSRYLINNREAIGDIQEVLSSISMKPKYNYGEINTEGLVWTIRFAGQGDYDLELGSYSNKNGKYYISATILDKVRRSYMDDKHFFPGYYKISEEQNEEIIQILFQALKDNLVYMTAERALQLSEDYAEWSEFMYYYAVEQNIYGKNAVRIPIQNTDMEIEIYYGMVHDAKAGYIEPIERAVLYDKEGNEYEYFSKEGREVLKKEGMKD